MNDIQRIKESFGQSAEQIIADGLGMERKGVKYRCFNSRYSSQHKHDVDKKPNMSWNDKALHFHCFTCKITYDIYNYYKEHLNYTHQEILEEAGLSMKGQNTKKNTKPKPKLKKQKNKNASGKPRKEKPEAYEDYTNAIIQLYNNQTEKDKSYFYKRGINDKTIDKYKLFKTKNYFKTDFKTVADQKKDDSYVGKNSVVIPYWEDSKIVYYTNRPTYKSIYYKIKDREDPLFNKDILKNSKTGEIIFVTEGHFDCLTLDQLGFKSVCTAGSGNTDKLIDAIDEIDGAEELTFISAFDNDAAGEDGTEQLKEGLKGIREKHGKEKFKFTALKLPKGIKDINEWFLAEGQAIKNKIDKQIENINIYDLKKPNNLYDYMINNFKQDIENNQKFKDRKTGFKNIDEFMSLYPGLYVLGGLSSLGKTTFIHQLADQVAEQGEHILFFSLEMDTLDLLTKSFSRRAKTKYNNTIPSFRISLNNLSSKEGKTVQKAMIDYQPIAKRFSIIRGNEGTGLDTIRLEVEKYVEKNKVEPIVIVDYLQILAPANKYQSQKEKIDSNVTELKRLSRDFNTPVMVISSLNRMNYETTIDFQSFNGSGGIEYTADVVWGFQLEIINENKIFAKDNNKGKKREEIKKAKKANPRHIELVCLKNRKGISNFSVGFEYFPHVDLFVPKPNASKNKEETGVMC